MKPTPQTQSLFLAFFLCISLVVFFAACNKSEIVPDPCVDYVTPEIIHDTVYPGPYFPLTEGSWWRYRTESGSIKLVEAGAPEYAWKISDSICHGTLKHIYGPYWGDRQVVGYQQLGSPHDAISGKWFTFMSEDAIIYDTLCNLSHTATFVTGETMDFSASAEFRGVIPADTVEAGIFSDVRRVSAFEDKGYLTGTHETCNCSYFYAPDVGLIKVQCLDLAIGYYNELELIDYFVAD